MTPEIRTLYQGLFDDATNRMKDIRQKRGEGPVGASTTPPSPQPQQPAPAPQTQQPAAGKVSIRLPDGNIATFPNQGALDAFTKKHGLSVRKN